MGLVEGGDRDRGKGEHGPHRQTDRNGRGEIPPGPAGRVAKPHLIAAGEEPGPGDGPVERPDTVGGHDAVILDRLPHGDTPGPVEGWPCRQDGPAETDDEAENHGEPAELPPDAGPAEFAAHERHEEVAEGEPDDGAEHRPDGTEEEGGPQVSEADLAPGATDRLHDPDLPGLLTDNRVHGGVDEHEGRQQRDPGDHVEQHDEVLEVL